MGSFVGHLLPAIGLILLALWWIVNIHYRYYTSLARKQKFYSSVMFYFNFLPNSCSKLPLEGFTILFLSALNVALESAGAIISGTLDLENKQHITMFTLYGIFALVEILMHFRCSLPPGAEYVALAQILVVQSLLMITHVRGRSSLNVISHQYLIYVAISCAFLSLVEIAVQNSYLLTLSRAYLIFLQGTWLFQMAFTLFSPTGDVWDESSYENLMLVTLYFAWYVLLNFVFVVVIGIIVKCKVHGISSAVLSDTKYAPIDMD